MQATSRTGLQGQADVERKSRAHPPCCNEQALDFLEMRQHSAVVTGQVCFTNWYSFWQKMYKSRGLTWVKQFFFKKLLTLLHCTPHISSMIEIYQSVNHVWTKAVRLVLIYSNTNCPIALFWGPIRVKTAGDMSWGVTARKLATIIQKLRNSEHNFVDVVPSLHIFLGRPGEYVRSKNANRPRRSSLAGWPVGQSSLIRCPTFKLHAPIGLLSPNGIPYREYFIHPGCLVMPTKHRTNAIYATFQPSGKPQWRVSKLLRMWLCFWQHWRYLFRKMIILLYS